VADPRRQAEGDDARRRQ